MSVTTRAEDGYHLPARAAIEAAGFTFACLFTKTDLGV